MHWQGMPECERGYTLEIRDINTCQPNRLIVTKLSCSLGVEVVECSSNSSGWVQNLLAFFFGYVTKSYHYKQRDFNF